MLRKLILENLAFETPEWLDDFWDILVNHNIINEEYEISYINKEREGQYELASGNKEIFIENLDFNIHSTLGRFYTGYAKDKILNLIPNFKKQSFIFTLNKEKSSSQIINYIVTAMATTSSEHKIDFYVLKSNPNIIAYVYIN